MVYSNTITKTIEKILAEINVELYTLGNVDRSTVFFSITDFSRKDEIIKAINESKNKWTVNKVEHKKNLKTGVETLDFRCYKGRSIF